LVIEIWVVGLVSAEIAAKIQLAIVAGHFGKLKSNGEIRICVQNRENA
jgi:hypothetical protein